MVEPQTTILSNLFLAALRQRMDEGVPVALVLVVATEGSTYSKTGDQILVDGNGIVHGILSGGCLEADIARRCKTVLETGVAALADYDLREEDDLYGLNVGCKGLMRVLILPLTPDSGYLPAAMLLEFVDDTSIVEAGVAYSAKALATGAVAYRSRDRVHAFNMDDSAAAELLDASEPPAGCVRFRIRRPPRVLVMGAGKDAEPLLQFGHSLGWGLTVCDHRPANIARLNAPATIRAECFPADEVAARLPLSGFDAAIVMSHNLASDGSYLRALASTAVDFIGLLGPPHRGERLLGDLGAAAASLAGRLRSPVGRRVGGRGPAAIALEVCTELQAYFHDPGNRLFSSARSSGESMSTAAGSN